MKEHADPGGPHTKHLKCSYHEEQSQKNAEEPGTAQGTERAGPASFLAGFLFDRDGPLGYWNGYLQGNGIVLFPF